jgi:hypothetical protein
MVPSFVPYFALTAALIRLEVGMHKATPTSLAEASAASTAKGLKTIHAHHSITDNSIMQSVALSNLSTPNLKSDVIEGVNQYIADMTEMVLYHGFAEQALYILRHRVENWHTGIIYTRPISVFTEVETKQFRM